MKFKTGDKVLFYRDVSNYTPSARNALLGTVITLGEEATPLEKCGCTQAWRIVEMGSRGLVVRDNEIEFEHIYDSPLYKTLL